MKVGDLVCLSSYGKKRKRAAWIERDDVGLIRAIKVHHLPWIPDEYLVDWIKTAPSSWRFHHWGSQRHNTRKDLIYVKNRKQND